MTRFRWLSIDLSDYAITTAIAAIKTGTKWRLMNEVIPARPSCLLFGRRGADTHTNPFPFGHEGGKNKRWRSKAIAAGKAIGCRCGQPTLWPGYQEEGHKGCTEAEAAVVVVPVVAAAVVI